MKTGFSSAPPLQDAGLSENFMIVGFTSLNESHDPELVSSRTSLLFERLSREVERYEGTIEKFAGDAMLAVFGVPAAHEDDPERAVRAALEMQAVAADLAGHRA